MRCALLPHALEAVCQPGAESSVRCVVFCIVWGVILCCAQALSDMLGGAQPRVLAELVAREPALLDTPIEVRPPACTDTLHACLEQSW